MGHLEIGLSRSHQKMSTNIVTSCFQRLPKPLLPIGIFIGDISIQNRLQGE